MENLSICRICLVQNVRTCTVNASLQEVYEKLTSITFVKKDKPLQLCYLCCAMLRNCRRLRNACLQSELILNQMLNNITIQPKILQDVAEVIELRVTPVMHFNVGDMILEVSDAVKNELPESSEDVIVNKGLYEETMLMPSTSELSSSVQDILKQDPPELLDDVNQNDEDICLSTPSAFNVKNESSFFELETLVVEVEGSPESLNVPNSYFDNGIRSCSSESSIPSFQVRRVELEQEDINISLAASNTSTEESQNAQYFLGKLKKPPKTAAQRNLEYRTRKRALKNGVIGNEIIQKISKDGEISNNYPLLYECLKRSNLSGNEQTNKQINQQNPSSFIHVDNNNKNYIKRLAKTSTERSRAYRARKKAKQLAKEQNDEESGE